MRPTNLVGHSALPPKRTETRRMDLADPHREAGPPVLGGRCRAPTTVVRDRDGDGEVNEEEFFRIMKRRGLP